jgi:hypothetical protein
MKLILKKGMRVLLRGAMELWKKIGRKEAVRATKTTCHALSVRVKFIIAANAIMK